MAKFKTLWCSNFVHSGMITIQEIRLLNLLWLTAITLQRYHVLQIDGGSVISITYYRTFWSRQTFFSLVFVWWNMSPLFFQTNLNGISTRWLVIFFQKIICKGEFITCLNLQPIIILVVNYHKSILFF